MSAQPEGLDRERLGALFERALELPPPERASFLDGACDGAAELRTELASLLASHASAPRFLDDIGEQLSSMMLDPFAEDVLPVGRVVGRYEIVSHLGSGGMGEVYRARDVTLDRPVALKVLPRHRSTDPEARERLVREARAASALDHPNIAVVYDIGAIEAEGDGAAAGGLYIAMSYYPGETLKQVIVRARLSVSDALGYAMQLADALAAAHRAGIVHRDVKPANVLVTPGGRLKLLDFGLARTIGADVTREHTTAGTVAYMSPEQTRGDAVDERTDVWSLGVVLYEMLSGARPFGGESDEAVLYGIRHDDPPALDSLRPDVAPALLRVVGRCLAKDPAQRYATAETVHSDLRVVSSATDWTRPSATTVASGGRRRSRLRRLTWKQAAAASVVVGVLAALLSAGWLTWSRSPTLQADRVVVAPFENRTGDPAHDPLGGVAAEWVTHELQHAGIAGVVPTDVAHASAAYVRARAKEAPGTPAIRALAEETGSGLVVSGAYYLRGDSLGVQVTITDARQRRTLALEPTSVAVGEPITAVALLGQRTLAAVAQILDTRLPPEMRFRERPSLNYEAYLARVAAWEAEARYEFDEALAHSDRARALDPEDLNSVLRSAWHRNRWLDMSPDRRARVDSLLDLLDRSRQRLVPADQALLDFMFARQGRDRILVYETAKRWATLSPGATEASVNWAIEALRSNRPREVIRILSDIDPDRFAQGHTLGKDYWATLLDAYHVLGDHREEVKAARRALALHPDDTFLLLWGAVALAAGGRVAEARASVDARLAQPTDRIPGPLMFMAIVGHELDIHGHEEAGRELTERTIAWYAGRPAAERDTYHPHYTLGYYALALTGLGRLDEAAAAFREFAAVASADTMPPGLAIWAHGWLGINAAQRGDLHEVGRLDEWLTVDRQPSGWGSFFRACIAAQLDRKGEAVALLRQAFGEGLYRNSPTLGHHRFRCFDALRDYGPFQDLIRPRG